MMEKNKICLLITMILALILFVGNVNAEENSCSTTDLYKLRQEAANVKATYVPGIITAADGAEENVLYLKVYNVTSNMALQYTYSGTGVQGDTFTLSSADIGKDGAVTVRQKDYGVVINYDIKVIATYGTCAGEVLKTIRVTLPMFNFYSLLDACQGIQDYYLCQPYIMTKLSSPDFFDKVEVYKEKMLEDKVVETEDDNNSVVSKAFTGVKKYKYVIVGVIVAIGVIATVLILKRKKSEIQ